MKKLYTLSLALVFSMLAAVKVRAQIILTPDTTICPNTTLTLQANSGGVVPTNLTMSDDFFTPTVNIGFSFTYFGNTYTQAVISSNGYISFNTANSSGFSPWQITAGIPGVTAGGSTLGNVGNSIMGYYADIYPPAGGTLTYATVGTAPNRKFVVSFCDAAMFSCTTLKASFQMILYETTNVIEVHLASIPLCTGWNSGNAIEGIQNILGTVAYPVAGRNAQQWTAYHSSHRWTPTSPTLTTAYTLSPINYAPVVNTSLITWLQNGVTPIGVGNTVNVTPTVNTYYVARIANCADTTRDTVYVTMGGGSYINNYTFTDPTTCGASDGTITLYGLDSNYSYLVKYKKDNAINVSYTTNSTAVGTITIGGLTAGSYDSVIAFKGFCFSNKIGPVVLTDPPITADYSYSIKYSCVADTVLFTNLSATPGVLYYKWSFGDNTKDTAKNPVHVYQTQNIFNAQLIATNGRCSDTLVKAIDLVHPLHASFTVDDDSICQHEAVAFTNTSITTTRNNISPTYLWDFGDGVSSTVESPTHNFDIPGEFIVKQYVTDFVPCMDTATWLVVVDTTPYISFIASDSFICEGQRIIFTGDYLKTGNTGFYWDFGDDYVMHNVNPITHAFDKAPFPVNIKLTATYRICADVSFEKSIIVKPFPNIDLGPDTSICPNGAPIRIADIANTNPQATYKWNNGETGNSIVVHNTGIYSATLTLDGCATADSVLVRKNCYIDIPNSFTPNDDGVTDYFFPRQLLSSGAKSFSMMIFNRWGEKIFETTNIDGRGWDGMFNGTVQPSGVYIYMINVSFINGTSEKYQGNVTLLR